MFSRSSCTQNLRFVVTTRNYAKHSSGRRWNNTDYPSKRDNKQEDPDENRDKISRTLSWLLRHSALGEMRTDGFVKVKDVLAHPSLRNMNVTQLVLDDVVKRDEKKRFTLLNMTTDGEDGHTIWIRANQGHSIPNIEVDMEHVIDAEKVPVAIHGTSEEAWKTIAQDGISKLKRHHIHLATGFADKKKPEVFSGIRKTSRILIHINVRKALEDGIKFYISSNGVILTPGNEHGILEPKYFKRVERVRKEIELLPGWEGTEEGSPSDSTVP